MWSSRATRTNGALVAVLCTAASLLFLFGCSPIEPGVWNVSGTDALLGSFEGTFEIRESPAGGLEAIRVVRLLERAAPDGRTVEVAWTGTIRTKPILNQSLAEFVLTRADFIPRLGSLVRTEADKDPLVVVGSLRESFNRRLTTWYGSYQDPAFSINEQGTFVGPPGPEPTFRAQRLVRATHREPPPILKDLLFRFFASYHALPDVQKYAADAAFKKTIHYHVVERTDFEYYRAHPDRLRVVNKVVDDISLAETEIRANAFRAPFHEKAGYYQEKLTNRFLGSHGMVENRTREGEPEPDHDGALWTGVYGYTQALRYLNTGDPRALDDLRAVVRGVHTLIDIVRVTGDKRNFARTLRLAGPAVGDGWVRGRGPFSHLDWKQGGNNDMVQGVFIGMIAGWEALPPGDPLRSEISSHALKLLDLCECLEDRDQHPECPGRDGLPLPSVNPGIAHLLAGITNGMPEHVSKGLELLHHPLLEFYPEIGGGPFYLYGISDWSGNHLSLVTTISLQRLLRHTDDAGLAESWERASAKAWEALRLLEHPLHAALAAGLEVIDNPDLREEAISEALWGLRSFPLPKHPYPVDHRIRGDFVLSPFPSLPWKLDWETNPGRMQSLVGHGLVESVADQYFWNGSVFSIGGGGIDPEQSPGVDYLFLYWLARTFSLIGPSD